MDLSCLRCFGGGHGYVKRGCRPAVSVAVAVVVLGCRSAEKRKARWRVVWRRVKKEKKRMFSCSSGGAREVQVPYNLQTYLQNFDESSIMMRGDDPDAISRSFSARFAISSAILQTF